jgi:hypothetical protein
MNLAQVTLEKFPSDTILLQEYEELLSLFNTELGALG